MSILSIVKNNFIRAIEKKYYVLTTDVTTLLPIIIAVLMTSKMQIAAIIAYVGPNKLNIISKSVSITYLKSISEKFELVSNRIEAAEKAKFFI